MQKTAQEIIENLELKYDIKKQVIKTEISKVNNNIRIQTDTAGSNGNLENIKEAEAMLKKYTSEKVDLLRELFNIYDLHVTQLRKEFAAKKLIFRISVIQNSIYELEEEKRILKRQINVLSPKNSNTDNPLKFTGNIHADKHIESAVKSADSAMKEFQGIRTEKIHEIGTGNDGK